MKLPRITIDQWIVLQAVVDEGSFAKAAIKLHRSQSTISYTIAKLQETLGLTLLELQGRRAVLTEAGKQILSRARHLARIAQDVEQSALNLQQGWETELSIVVDGIFPRTYLFAALQKFNAMNQFTRLHIYEEILSGPTEALIEGRADLAITSKIPQGFSGDKIIEIESMAYAHPNHPLHQLRRELTEEDLRTERYIVVRDSGVKGERNEGWLGSEYLWKVDSIDLKVNLVAQGIGFSWLPRLIVEERQLPLKPLPLQIGRTRHYPLYLVLRDLQKIGPSCQQLTNAIKEVVMQKITSTLSA